jgi:hypothetical protein
LPSLVNQDISGSIKQLSEVNQLIDASLDVFCTINELGYFMYVSIAAINHWDTPRRVNCKSYRDFIVVEDLPKTTAMTSSILSGEDIEVF